MKTTHQIIICLTTVFLLQSLPAHCETRYVSDQLYITLRTGKSQQHEIIRTLKTDTPLEVLDDSDKRYLKVRTPGGKTGYVLKQYITGEKPKSMIIRRLKRENEEARQKTETLESRIEELQNRLASRKNEYASELGQLNDQAGSLEKQLANSQSKLAELKQRYEKLHRQSGNLDNIISERNTLRDRNSSLTDRISSLEKKNARLKNLALIKWFLAGAGVFLLGWLLGKTPRRKKMRW